LDSGAGTIWPPVKAYGTHGGPLGGEGAGLGGALRGARDEHCAQIRSHPRLPKPDTTCLEAAILQMSSILTCGAARRAVEAGLVENTGCMIFL
jgi:hypothetical protein